MLTLTLALALTMVSLILFAMTPSREEQAEWEETQRVLIRSEQILDRM